MLQRLAKRLRYFQRMGNVEQCLLGKVNRYEYDTLSCLRVNCKKKTCGRNLVSHVAWNRVKTSRAGYIEPSLHEQSLVYVSTGFGSNIE